MGVTGEHQAHVVFRGGRDGLGLVGQEHHGPLGIAALHCPLQFGAVSRLDATAFVVVDAGQVESGTIALDRDPLIPQHPQSQQFEVLEPSVQIVEVLVVASDEEDAVGGGQLPQRLHLLREAGHRALRQVACDCDEVRVQLLRLLHHTGEPLPAMDQVQVKVGQLDDGEAVQLCGQLRQGDFQPPHHETGQPPPDGEDRREQNHTRTRSRRGSPEKKPVGGITEGARQSGDAGTDADEAPGDIDAYNEEEEERYEAEPDVDRDDE